MYDYENKINKVVDKTETRQNSTWRLNERGKIEAWPQDREILRYIRNLTWTGYASKTDIHSSSSRKNTEAYEIKRRFCLANFLSVTWMSDEINDSRQVILTIIHGDSIAEFMNISEL
jgi:hypothetical protein